MGAKCKILFWDSDFRVTGIVASLKSGGKIEITSTSRGSAGASLATQLREVSSELKNSQADAVLLGGFFSEFICFELTMPALNRAALQNALQFELIRRIPAQKEGMVTSFRVMPSSAPQQVKVRVFAVRSRIWHELLDNLKECAVRFDAICHPFMAAELTEQRRHVEFPNVSPGLSLVLNDSGQAELRLAETVPDDADTAGETLAAYALSSAFRHDRPYLSQLPEEFRLHRFKHRRNFAVFLGVVTVCLAGILGYFHWNDRRQQFNLLRQEIHKLDTKLRIQKAKNEELRPVSAFAGKMIEAAQDEPVLPAIDMLTGKLPANVWVTAFKTGSSQISVTLSVSGDSSNLTPILADLGAWTVDKQNQQRAADGTETWYLTLKRK